jgi:hypothetical protein
MEEVKRMSLTIQARWGIIDRKITQNSRRNWIMSICRRITPFQEMWYFFHNGYNKETFKFKN